MENKQLLSVLILNKKQENTNIILKQLNESEYDIRYLHIKNEQELNKAITIQSWDVIICAYDHSTHCALNAISILRQAGLDIPVIVVADAIGEDKAVALMRAGIHDIFLKNDLKRLITAIEREVRDASSRKSRRKAEELLRENEHRMRLLLDSMKEAFIIGKLIRDKDEKPLNWKYLYVNEAYKNITGKEDIVGKLATEAYPDIKNDNPELFEVFDRVTRTGEREKYLSFFKYLKKWLNASSYGIGNDEFVVVYEDVTEVVNTQKELGVTQQRIRDVLEISRKRTDSLDEMLRFSLFKVVNLFKSEYGYFFYYNELNKELTLQAWNDAGMRDCKIENPGRIYPLDSTGIWGDVVRKRKAVIINDYQAKNPRKKGYPDGHVRIERFMSVPVFNNGKIVAVAGVANRKDEYTHSDAMQMSIMLDSIWKIAEWMRIMEDLKKSEEKFATAFHFSPLAMGIVTINKPAIIEINRAFEDITNLPREKILGTSVEKLTEKFRPAEFPFVFKKALAEKHFSGLEFQFNSRKKGSVYVSISAETIEFEGQSCILFVGQDITTRKQAEEELKRSREQLKQYAAHLQTVREEERVILSRDLHDNLGQSLTALRMDVYRIIKKLGKSGDEEWVRELEEEAKEMMQLVDSTLDTVRKISREMRPRILDELGLLPAIQWQIEEFEKYSGIICPFKSKIKRLSMSIEDSTGVFRILQEALTNISRHSKAKRAEVILSKNKTDLQMVIADDGIGISEENLKSRSSLGLLSMSERAYLFGGTLTITGSKASGTKITLKIPLEKVTL